MASTYSIQMDTWDVLCDSYTLIPSNQIVTGWITDISTNPFTVKQASWTISDYTALVAEQSRRHAFDSVLDNDIEQFMVWPDTNPAQGWKGWCLDAIQKIPVACP